MTVYASVDVLQTHGVSWFCHLQIHYMSRIPFLILSVLGFIAYILTVLIFQDIRGNMPVLLLVQTNKQTFILSRILFFPSSNCKHRSLPDSDNTGELWQTFRSCCEISRNGEIIYLIHLLEFKEYCHVIYHENWILINLFLNEILIFLLKNKIFWTIFNMWPTF